MATTPHDKLAALRQKLRDMKDVLIAYSGGVDSTFLLTVAVQELGQNAKAITAISSSYPAWELDEARTYAQDMGAEMIEVTTHELSGSATGRTQGDRCYHCKTELFEVAAHHAQRLGYKTTCYGAIPDDLGDDRPGMRAADEHSIRAPLIESGLTKADIRILSKALDIPTWDKPATACLSSRFPVGYEVTSERLEQVERCESELKSLGFNQLRARFYDHRVRVELGRDDLDRVMKSEALRASVIERCKAAGFKDVVIDPNGYRQGGAQPAPIQIYDPARSAHS